MTAPEILFTFDSLRKFSALFICTHLFRSNGKTKITVIWGLCNNCDGPISIGPQEAPHMLTPH